MNWDWLLGPQVKDDTDGFYLRPSWVDLTTVKDVVALLEPKYGHVQLNRTTRNGELHIMKPDDLDGLSNSELGQVYITASPGAESGGGSGHIVLPFDPDGPSRLSIDNPNAEYARFARSVAEKIVDEGRPRFTFTLLAPKLLLAGLVVAVGAWLWFVIGSQPPVSLIVTGSAIVLLVALLSVDLYRRQTAKPPNVGHRIVTFTRDQLRAERANSRANVKAVLATSVVTIPLGAVLGALAQRSIG